MSLEDIFCPLKIRILDVPQNILLQLQVRRHFFCKFHFLSLFSRLTDLLKHAQWTLPQLLLHPQQLLRRESQLLERMRYRECAFRAFNPLRMFRARSISNFGNASLARILSVQGTHQYPCNQESASNGCGTPPFRSLPR